MLTNHDSDWNIDNLTDTEIFAAIRYLEPEQRRLNEWKPDDDIQDNGVLICVSLYTALFVCFAVFCFYWR